MDVTSILVSNNIRVLRKARFETHKEFAKRVGIPQSTLSVYESGKVTPSIDVLTKIASACRVSVDWLCGETLPYRMQNLGDAVAAFISLFEARDIRIRTTIHDQIENEVEGEEDDEKRNWVELRIYETDKASIKHEKVDYNAALFEIVKRAYRYTEELRKYERSQEDYEKDVNALMTRYQLYGVNRLDHTGLSEEERKLRMLAVMKSEWESIEKKRMENGEGPLEFEDYRPPVD